MSIRGAGAVGGGGDGCGGLATLNGKCLFSLLFLNSSLIGRLHGCSSRYHRRPLHHRHVPIPLARFLSNSKHIISAAGHSLGGIS